MSAPATTEAKPEFSMQLMDVATTRALETVIAYEQYVKASHTKRPRWEQWLLRLRAILLDYDFEYAELFSAILGIGWGGWIMLPFPSFASSPVYAAMVDLAPEQWWGALVFFTGLAQLFCLLSDTEHDRTVLHRPRRRRMWATMASFLVWMLLSGFLIAGNPVASSSIVYPLIASTAGWAYLRLSVKRAGVWNRR